MAEIASIEAKTLAAEEAVQATSAEAKTKSVTAAETGLAAGQLKTEVETLAKLLGDDLDAPVAQEAPMHWRLNVGAEPDPALPRGVEPLVAHVAGPPELTRRLR